jgi:hypothetical protein
MSKALATKNVATVLVAVAMIFGFAFTFATPAKADVISDLQAQIQALLAQISALQGGSGSQQAGGLVCINFTRSLTIGSTGSEVMSLQKFLNSVDGTQLATTGAGSPGNETSYFGSITRAAVSKFQQKYGITPTAGYWGPISRAKAASLCAAAPTPTPPGTPTPIPTGPGITVAPTAQPANSLAPEGAARVPLTTFTLTNNSGAVVTVTGVSVQRVGLAADAVFAGLVLVDETGMQLGNAKTLNSNHQAVIGDSFNINPGQTKTLTVAGNMAADLDTYSGQVVGVSVIGINTNVAVSGSLPISGAQQTVNSTLAVGTLPVSVGPSDLDSAQANESIGTTGRVGAGIRAQAGAAEDVWVKSVRWNQSGSAAPSDLANVVTTVDGTTYPTTISSDGKYYTAVFPGNGIQIMKGLQKEFVLKFDIVGGPARTVNFDIYKATDIFAVGGTYGYGITPTQSDDGTVSTASEFTAGSPFFSGSTFTINAGTVTSLSRANEVTAQNVVEASPNQILGGFAMDVKGEPISIQSLIFHFGITGSTADAVDITNVSLVDENGAVVAGPVNGVALASKVTFTDTVTFPTGRHVYTLKGQLGTDFANGDTIQASTTPSSDWSNATGQSTGNSISLSTLSSAVTANIMTVKGGAVALSINGSPAAQTIVAGVAGLTVSSIKFDANQSGEDVRFNSAKFLYNETSASLGTGEDPTNCFAYDGATRLNSTAINPTTDATDHTFTFDTALVVAKGTGKDVTIKCDIPSGAVGGFNWGLESAASFAATFTGTGVASTQTITPTVPNTGGTDTAGNVMTVTGSGALTVALDSSSPAYALAAAGSTNVVLGALRFNGTNEAMRLERVALQMSNAVASSSPADLTQVTIWDGATQVGTAFFSGTNRNATSTLSSTVIIPANGSKTLTVKGDLALQGTGQAGTSGALIQVDYDDDDSTGTRAIGQSSGATTNRTASADTEVDGVRVFRSLPTVAKIAVPSTSLNAGTMDLYRFSVSADAKGDVSLYQIVANIATSTGSASNGTTTLANFKVYAYTNSDFTGPVSGFTDGQVVATVTSGVAANGDTEFQFSSILTVPAGATRYFKLVADVTGTAGTTNWSGSVSTKISGDSAYPALATTVRLAGAAVIDEDGNDDFIWSPNSTSSTPAFANNDWTNGFGVAGLSSGGTDVTTISR